MDYFRQDSAHIANGLSLNQPVVKTSENANTHKRWARSVLTFYACLFLAGAVAIGIHQTSFSGTQQHQASLQTDIRSPH
ncbi:hypothetical protein ACFQZO_32865 [Bradyrhizobium sp. GCM10027634]|uniref:hypothetical protein n=1 Tax=unclassified Bradyrhizobium TaxID=2631580 RepID=UPI001889F4DC|nr:MULTISPECIES: hypothetical protein [unclassified Bradyrhizobium]MDN5005649.1 hypothetical protein [Bradyrhizobium sp. WYCCWR 12677]